MTMPGHPTRSLFLVTALLVPACAGNPTPPAPVAAAERSEPKNGYFELDAQPPMIMP